MSRSAGRATAVLGAAILALTARPSSGDELVGLDPVGALLTLDTTTGATSNRQVIHGIEDDGEPILAIARRPRNGVLYGLSRERLCSIDVTTAVATPVGPRFTSTPGARPFGFAFDLLRDAGRGVVPLFPPGAGGTALGTRDLRIDPDTGESFEDADPATGQPPMLSYVADDAAVGTAPIVTAIAYAGVAGTPTDATVFGIDTERGTLVRLGSPRGAYALDDVDAVTTIGALNLPTATSAKTLEIDDAGRAFLLAQRTTPVPTTVLFSLDLTDGAATLVADVPWPLADLASPPTATLPGAAALDVTKATFKIDFHRTRRDADEIQIVGTLPFPVGGWAGKTMRVDVGGVVRSFVLDVRGRGVQGTDSVRFGRRWAETGFPFTVQIRRGRLLRGLFGQATGAGPSGARQIDVDVWLDGKLSRARLDLDFVARGARGTARLSRD
jgi:hypothetical protein